MELLLFKDRGVLASSGSLGGGERAFQSSVGGVTYFCQHVV